MFQRLLHRLGLSVCAGVALGAADVAVAGSTGSAGQRCPAGSVVSGFADDGTLMSVSVFRDARGAEESVRTAATWVEQTLAKLLPEKPEVLSGEVFAHRQLEKQKAA